MLAGFSLAFANDIDRHAAATHELFVQAIERSTGTKSGHTYVVADISASYSTLERSPRGVLIGGPPCQGFSRAGRMDPNDPRSVHVQRMMDALEAVKPAAFVMENVAALATNERWRPVLDAARTRAEGLGYAVALHVLDAADFGVPQHRQRMFLVGVRDKSMEHTLHTPLNTRAQVSVRTSLAAGTHFRMQPRWTHSGANIVPARKPVVRRSPFAGMLFNGQGRPLDLEAPAPTISASLGGNHTPILDQDWLNDPAEGGDSVAAYHRSIVEGSHPSVPPSWRRITVYEAARLQTFPTSVDWNVSKSVAFRHIGNAVPPLLAFEVAGMIAKAVGADFSAPTLAALDLADLPNDPGVAA